MPDVRASEDDRGLTPASHRLLLAFKLALAAVLLYWLVATGRFDVARFRALLSETGVALLAAIFVLQVLAFVAFIARWHVLTKALRIPVGMPAVMRTGLQGLSSSLVIPGSLGIDGIRLVHLRRHHRQQFVAGASSIVMDKVTGFVALLILGVVASAGYGVFASDDRLNGVLAFNAVLLLLALGVVIAAAVVLPRLKGGPLDRFEPVARFAAALATFSSEKAALGVSLGLALVGHLFTCAAWGVGLYAIGAEVPVLGVVALTAILIVARAIPLTPLGLGVTDGLAEALYRLIDISAGAELQMLVRLLSVAIFVVFGLSFFLGARNSVAQPEGTR